MARLPRYNIINQPQHIILRGNNRNDIFVETADYQFFLEKLAIACHKFGCLLHAYVLMTNHVHLLITPTKTDSLSKTLQSLGRYYVQYFNHTYQRTGTLWEGRYKATLIDSEQYLLSCMRYIELNPVRANMVQQPHDYPWSSFGCNALGMVAEAIKLDEHIEYQKVGLTQEERRHNYLALFNTPLDDKEVDLISESTNKSWVLGSSRFKDEIAQLTDRALSARPRGGDRKSTRFRQGTREGMGKN